MSTTVNPQLIREIRKHGAFDISACFHCGNCTAVCPLSDRHGAFPRRLIRLTQIGDRERLLSGPEPWLCYYCGECSETCPRQAEPGAFMAAVRRYAIAQSEPTSIGRLMAGGALGSLLVTLLVGIVLAAFLVTVRAGADPKHWVFGWVSYATIHNLGAGVFVAAALSLLGGIVTTFRRCLKGPGAAPIRTDRAALLGAARDVVAEIATMKRHRETTADAPAIPLLQRHSTIHLAIMWGFLGLLAATTLDFLFLVLIPTGWSIFWPARALGTVAGVVMLWGVVAASMRRLRGEERNAAHSQTPDWWVLAFLFVLAVTGFWLEVVAMAGIGGSVSNAILLIHAAMAMELVLLVSMTKMAHALYRPIALFVHALRVRSADQG